VVYDKASASFTSQLSKKTTHGSTLLKSGPITIEKTPEEKKAILEPVFQQYITDVAAHYAGKVAAWDVVNEPMNDNGTLRTGEEDLKASSVFYWQYYLGKDFAVTAFKAAKAADSSAKLFINDYGLESATGSKLDGLIEYVNYIESQGAQVDGIGTQMHLNINWSDTTAINTMFQKLAATGKLIKVSELDIAIANASNPESPVSPTAEQYAQQAELYRFVAGAFNKYIPEAQRYGITVWGVSDNANEHEYWLKNDAPCLWDADYARKHAYKGLADGLAGQDVSAGFTGELVY
jgi:GH35 family endo-1,4-beta-xylanase